MTPRVDPTRDPARTLDAEVAAYARLLELLQREQDALLSADADAVQDAAIDKARQVDLLRELASERSAALRNAGFDAGAAGVEAWLATDPGAARGRSLWTKLCGLAADARSRNALNGRLILTQQRHWDRALTALWQAGGAATTYGADGRARRDSAAARTLAAI